MNRGPRDGDRSGSWGFGGRSAAQPPINRSRVVEWLGSITDILSELVFDSSRQSC
jgi:hypothetical protein